MSTTYLPDFGWVEFDPTNDLIPGAEPITLAYGRDFGDVTPVRGVILGWYLDDGPVGIKRRCSRDEVRQIRHSERHQSD